MSKTVEVKKVFIYTVEGIENLTVNEDEAKADPDYRLATFEDLMDDPIFKDIVCEVEEGMFVYWERRLNCVLDMFPSEEEFDYGYAKAELPSGGAA